MYFVYFCCDVRKRNFIKDIIDWFVLLTNYSGQLAEDVVVWWLVDKAAVVCLEFGLVASLIVVQTSSDFDVGRVRWPAGAFGYR